MSILTSLGSLGSIVRPVILFIIVVLAVTYIPIVTVSPENRVIIGLTVVGLFYLLDKLTSWISWLKKETCHVVCGCDSSDSLLVDDSLFNTNPTTTTASEEVSCEI